MQYFLKTVIKNININSTTFHIIVIIDININKVIVDKNLQLLKKPTYEELYKLSISQADGVIFTSGSSKDKFKDFVRKDASIMECTSNEDYENKYLQFYNSFFDE